MSGSKTIYFKTEVMSPVYGSFLAGDVYKNAPAEFAEQCIAAGIASAGEGKAASDAAGAAGRLNDDNKATASDVRRHAFKPDNEGQMRQAGVIRDGEQAAPVGNRAPESMAGATKTQANLERNAGHEPVQTLKGARGGAEVAGATRAKGDRKAAKAPSGARRGGRKA